MIFPLSFLISFIWNIGELYTDKVKLIKYSQRPIPKTERTIGNWLQIMDLVIDVAVVFTSGVIGVICSRNDQLKTYQIHIFLLNLMLNMLLRFILKNISGNIPSQIILMLKRHLYLIKSTLDQFKRITAKSFQQHLKGIKGNNLGATQARRPQAEPNAAGTPAALADTLPIYKIFGTLIDPEIVMNNFAELSFEDLSDDSLFELEQHEPDNVEDAALPVSIQNTLNTQTCQTRGSVLARKPPKLLPKKSKGHYEQVWVESKLFAHQSYVSRSVLKRNLMLKNKSQQQGMHRYFLTLQYKKQGKDDKQISRRFQKKKVSVFTSVVRGAVQMDMFRRYSRLL